MWPTGQAVPGAPRLGVLLQVSPYAAHSLWRLSLEKSPLLQLVLVRGSGLPTVGTGFYLELGPESSCGGQGWTPGTGEGKPGVLGWERISSAQMRSVWGQDSLPVGLPCRHSLWWESSPEAWELGSDEARSLESGFRSRASELIFSPTKQ